MEIIFQYTVTDIRRFVEKYEYLTEFSAFRCNKNANDFIKSTGQYYSGITKEFLQAYDFDSKRSIKINKWLSFCKKKEIEGINLFLSRRFYFDHFFVSGIYEICFSVDSDSEIDYKSLIKELLSLQIRIPKVYKIETLDGDFKSDFSGKEYLTTLGNAKKAFLRHYNFATSQKKTSSDLQDSLKYINCSEPYIFIKSNIKDKIYLPYSPQKKTSILIQNFSIMGANGLKYNTSLFHDFKENFILSKNVYILINEIPVFRQSLLFIFDNIVKGELSPAKKSIASNNLQSFLIDTIKKLNDKDFVSSIPSEYNDIFLQSNLIQLQNNLQTQINVRPNTFRKVCDYIEKEIKRENIKTNKQIITISNSTVEIKQDNGNMENQQRKKESIWINGSFFITLFIIIITSIITVLKLLPAVVLPLIIIGVMLLYSVVGAFILRSNGDLSEKSFLELMAMSFKNIKYLFRQNDSDLPQKNEKRPDNSKNKKRKYPK